MIKGLVVFCLLASPQLAYAAPDLSSGMSVGEVLLSWGEPTDKVEHETKRMEVWSYPAGKVIFQEGRVVLFPANQRDTAQTAALAQSPKSYSYPGKNPDRERAMDNLLSEVLGSIPSEADAKSGPEVKAPRGASRMGRQVGEADEIVEQDE